MRRSIRRPSLPAPRPDGCGSRVRRERPSNTRTSTSGQMQLMDWDLPWEARHRKSFFEDFAARPGFAAAYACDADDLFWQTERNPENWDVLGRDRRGMKLIKDPNTGRRIIDVSGNPGRIELVQGMRLQSSWRMWFGPGAERHFDRTRVLAFPEAARLRLLESGVVFVELYEDGQRPELAEHRRVQQAFRDWLEMSAILERAGQPAGPFDPQLELEDGSFAHGGVRQATVWLDADGRPVSRSQASHKRVVELSAKGNVIWAGESRAGA